MIKLSTVFAVTVLLSADPSPAHESWISSKRILNPVTQEWCCGANECGIVTPPVATAAGWAIHSEVIIDFDGRRVRVDEVVPYREVIPSPGGYFWRCHSTVNLAYGVTNDSRFLIDGERRCFFAPPQAL